MMISIKRGFGVLLMLIAGSAMADPVWIDVRTLEEKQANGIEGDPLIPYGEIVEQVRELHPDTSTEIYLYCRSGNRSGQATLALTEAGYGNVFNAGSIEDARKQRGLAN